MLKIKRFHLYEFCDQPWLKGWMREAFMDCLGMIYKVARPYHKFSDDIVSVLGQRKQIIDLATGSGESVSFFLRFLKNRPDLSDIKVVGTDLFPNQDALTDLEQKYPNFAFRRDSVNAFSEVLESTPCVYTIFTAFHHFGVDEAVCLIRSRVSSGSDLLVFELNERHNLLKYVWCLVGGPVFMLTPFLARKWRWQKFVFSTLLPIIPLMLAYDGVISNLRTYSEVELEELARLASPEGRIRVQFRRRYFMPFLSSYMCRFYWIH